VPVGVIYDNITVFHSSGCLCCACAHHATPTLVGRAVLTYPWPGLAAAYMAEQHGICRCFPVSLVIIALIYTGNALRKRPWQSCWREGVGGSCKARLMPVLPRERGACKCYCDNILVLHSSRCLYCACAYHATLEGCVEIVCDVPLAGAC